ncbi:methyltransferase [Thamnocephalis sphaerospora]|uniref:Methyltransferase n=1 Tax=Thamnocephalis sphaerospora TaxID=78915 RepID=A0A4P9XKC1_9FUNG|nr:methyltransferase [Thamnocephalis sphaerospora]|eukprot:RKP05690.1 methyltransferase [Thamnocephalis sphaerospora]
MTHISTDPPAASGVATTSGAEGLLPNSWTDALVDSGMAPDFVLRYGIRRFLAERVAQIRQVGGWEAQTAAEMGYVQVAQTREATINTDEANEQHYEVPTEFLRLCLGKRMKYSACVFPPGVTDLSKAEEITLEEYCRKADLKDGQKVLDLGCGWGSLTLFLAERYPNSVIYSLSNSSTQRAHIEAECKRRNLNNVRVFVGDVAVFEFPAITRDFDRILSVEMLEHVRNHPLIFKKVSSWLSHSDDARFFVHVFCHRTRSYDFDTEEGDSWMARHFFTGGCMPSESLFMNYQQDLRVVNRWAINGSHYGATSEAWLKTLDSNRETAIERVLDEALQEAHVRFNRWRVFFMAVAECFAYDGGEEWGVVHYLFARQS